ncbi:hypothetical protein V1514DRAFT_328249, partial [Lipomyces japonicus]|uniref:uncharacterized protein n=1 Tax=Lipomyces japonicus TaxID=56871 RepID=UPI0034CE070B
MSSQKQPLPHRSASILVSDVRHQEAARRPPTAPLPPQTQQQRGAVPPPPRRYVRPVSTLADQRHSGKFSEISVGHIVNDLPSRRSPLWPVRDQQYADSNPTWAQQRPRDPRLLLTDPLGAVRNKFSNKSQRRRRRGAGNDDEEDEGSESESGEEYEFSSYSSSQSDLDNNAHEFENVALETDKVTLLPMPFEEDGNVYATTGGPPSDTARRVSAFLMAEEYDLDKINNFLSLVHNVKGSKTIGAGSPDAALYLPYALPLLPGGRAGWRVRSGKYDEEHEQEPVSGHDLPEIDQNEREIATYEGHEDFVLDKKGELFIFRYGVMVFWNFTEKQERDILADIAFADNEEKISHLRRSSLETMSSQRSSSHLSCNMLASSLRSYLGFDRKYYKQLEIEVEGDGIIVRRIPDDEKEIELFKFEYSRHSKSPQIYNDLITLKPHKADYMHKLTMSHAIAQSTKLSHFETKMERYTSRSDLERVPKQLTFTGSSNVLNRMQINQASGRLFRLRMDVNLNSSVLDVPEFFWEEEPELHAYYMAIRDYLEIKRRISVLNQRCMVYLDLLEVLADGVADSNMSSITWIIIVLIAVSLCVSATEIFLRYNALSKLKEGPEV